MLLNWSTPKAGITGIESQNGFASWGFLSLAGMLGVVVLSFIGDKAQPYAGQFKQIAMAAFGLMVVGAVIFMIRIMTGSQEFNTIDGGRQTYKLSQLVKPGFGLFLCIAAGLGGLVLLSGIIKIPTTGTSNPSVTPGSFPPTPPPPPGAIPTPTGSMPPPPPPPPSN